MATKQTINASVLTDWLEATKQMQEGLKEFSGLGETTAHRFSGQIQSALSAHVLDKLDALRALVAEQERESETQHDSRPACCNGGTQDNPCGCNGASEYLPIEKPAPITDFQVGDEVEGEDGAGKTKRMKIVEAHNDRDWWVVDDGGWWPSKDLRLVRREVKA